MPKHTKGITRFRPHGKHPTPAVSQKSQPERVKNVTRQAQHTIYPMQSARPLLFPLSMTTSSTSRMAMYVGVAGLSAAGIYGAFKCVSIWKHLQHLQAEDGEKRRKQEEELGLLRRSLVESRTDIEEKKKSVRGFTEEIDRLGKRVLETERELDAARRQNRTLADRTRTLTAQNQHLEGDLNRTKEEQKHTAELLEVRTAELKGAQAFLTKADQLSGADVIKLVEELNGEIMQAAASMAEELTIEEKKIDTEGKEQESDETREANTRTEDIVGPRMTEMLKTLEHHEDPILIQIAFQTGMAAYAHWMISSWCFESPEDEHMLSEIYARVRESEEQAVSGRWRQLTRTHLQRMLAHEPDLLSDMAEALAHIIVTAGFKESTAVAHERIMTRFADQIGVVMKIAQRLNKKIGEGITSCDLEVLYIAPDIPYNTTSMDDAFSPTTGNGKENVVCTTELGLVRAERVSGDVANWNESVLLKPKVVLPSGLVSITGSD